MYFYYYPTLNQYKCTSDFNCPTNYNFFIKEKLKCIDNCEKDNTYKYQYNGECYIECPKDTYHEDNTFICKDKNINKCLLSQNVINTLNQNITDTEIEKYTKNFATEFQ